MTGRLGMPSVLEYRPGMVVSRRWQRGDVSPVRAVVVRAVRTYLPDGGREVRLPRWYVVRSADGSERVVAASGLVRVDAG